MIAQRRAELAAEVAERLGGTGVACDITDFDQLEDVTAQIMTDHGHIDIGVNYAGYEKSTPIRDLTPEILEPMVQVQLTGAIYFLRAMGNAMSDNPDGTGGSIISTSSTAGVMGGLGPHGYTAAKHAVVGLTKSVANELAQYGVRVNAISPGNTVTAMTAGVGTGDHTDIEGASKYIAKGSPLGYAGFPEDIANAALYLASDESRYVSGHTLVVDAGQTTSGMSVNRFHNGDARVFGAAGQVDRA